MNFRQKLLAATTVVGAVTTAIYSAADEETYADTAGVGAIGGVLGGVVTFLGGAVVNAAVNYFTSEEGEEDEDFTPESDSDSAEFDEDINAELEDGEYQQLMLEGPQQPLMLTWIQNIVSNDGAEDDNNVDAPGQGRAARYPRSARFTGTYSQ